ncbi:MAG: polysaccharide biosynthesis protein [Clostridia bacterium]|nr:polysaccharide biosynthesis protein [Clostridia bacterium]
MKFRINKYLKTAIVLFSFVICYIASSLLATFLLNYSLKDFFKHDYVVAIIGIAMIVLLSCTTKLHLSSYRHASIAEAVNLLIMSFIIMVVSIIVSLLIPGVAVKHSVVTVCIFFIGASCLVFSNRLIDFLKKRYDRKSNPDKKVIIVGAGSAGNIILKEIQTSNKIRYNVVGFVDNDKNKIGTYISGVKVLGEPENIKLYADITDADLIIIAIPTATAKEIKRLSNLCLETSCELKILPGIYQMLDGEISVSRLRNVDVQDLLGREPINLNNDEVMGYIKGEVVLVTGGGGSIGSELCRQIASHEPKQLIILDIYENSAYEIEQELKRTHPELNLLTLIASVRDSVKMDDVFRTYKPGIVFHAAAHKHVPLMETSPNEAVKNNIIGTYKVVKCADRYKVKRFVQISTDKAVNPTNIMGATKRVCEMIIQAFAKKSETKFVAVRFGNVLGSNGSVIPLFKKQIAEGGPVTVTHKDIIRYFMTIPEAVSLVLQAGAYAEGGEIFVLDMGEQVRIYDLACNLIRLSGYEPEKDIEIKITGLRPGEKLYEERLMAEEGLKKTANDRISIGKPLEIDEQKLFDALNVLYDEAYSESTRMKQLVHDLVPTYKIDEGNSNK